MAGSTRQVHRGAGPIPPAYHEEHNNVVTDLETLRAAVAADGIFEGAPLLAVDDGTATKVEMFGRIRYRIGGEEFFAPPTAGITLPGTDDITATKYGAWRFEIDRTGAITAVPAVAVGSDQAFASAEAALLALSATARAANTVPVGYLVIQAAAGGFTVGTDSPVTSDAQVTSATYYDVRGSSGVVAAPTLAVGATPEQIAQGAGTVKVNGLRKAEISAAAGLTFAVADTIDADKFGGFLLVSTLAGTAIRTLSADGDPAVSAQAYATSAAAEAALDALEAAMPELFAVVGRLVIENDGTEWVGNTDDLDDASDVTTATFTAKTAGTYTKEQMESATDLVAGLITD